MRYIRVGPGDVKAWWAVRTRSPSPTSQARLTSPTSHESTPFLAARAAASAPIGEVERTGHDAHRGRRAISAVRSGRPGRSGRSGRAGRPGPAGIAVCVPVNTRTAKPSQRVPWGRLGACQPPKPADRGHDDGFDPAMLTGKHMGRSFGPGRPRPPPPGPRPRPPPGPRPRPRRPPQAPAGSGSVTVVGSPASNGSVQVQAAPWCLPTAPWRAASTRNGNPKISIKPTADA